MSANPITATATTDLEEAMSLMREHQIRRLIVVDDEARVVGIATIEDLLAAMASEFGQLVQALRRRARPRAGASLGALAGLTLARAPRVAGAVMRPRGTPPHGLPRQWHFPAVQHALQVLLRQGRVPLAVAREHHRSRRLQVDKLHGRTALARTPGPRAHRITTLPGPRHRGPGRGPARDAQDGPGAPRGKPGARVRLHGRGWAAGPGLRTGPRTGARARPHA